MPDIPHFTHIKLIMAGMCLIITGCTAVDPFIWRDPSVNKAWPPPPNAPRVVFLREIYGPDDIVPAKGKIERFLELVTGEKQVKLNLATPYGITTDGNSVIYVADTSDGVVHRYNLANREVSYITRAGDEFLVSPVGVAVDSSGNLYVTDSVKAKVFKYNKRGEFQHELLMEKGFMRPAGIAINGLNEKFVVDVLAHKLYRFDRDDSFTGDFPQEHPGEELNSPTNVTIDRSGNVYVSDSMNFMVRIYDHNGKLQRSIGGIGDSPGSFARPKGISLDSDGHIYVIDANHDNFQVFDQNGELLLFVGKGGREAGEFYLPSGISIDKQDRIFVTDTYNHRIQVFEYLKEGGKHE